MGPLTMELAALERIKIDVSTFYLIAIDLNNYMEGSGSATMK